VLVGAFEDVAVYASDCWAGFIDQVNNVFLRFGCWAALITDDLSVRDFDIVEGNGGASV
jgi:hypothetical protein